MQGVEELEENVRGLRLYKVEGFVDKSLMERGLQSNVPAIFILDI